jgi:ABC-type spermidine/putrescine transport system permease subunit II
MSHTPSYLADWHASLSALVRETSLIHPVVTDVPVATLSILPAVLLSALILVWYASRRGNTQLCGMLLQYMVLPCLNLALLLWLALTLLPSTQQFALHLDGLLQAGR